MSQYSLNTLTIASLIACSFISFSSDAQISCKENTLLELDQDGQFRLDARDLLVESIETSEAQFTVSQEEFDCSDIGTHAIEVTMTNQTGETFSCVSAVKVMDLMAPKIEADDIRVTEEELVSLDLTEAYRVSDNCTSTDGLTVDLIDAGLAEAQTGETVQVKVEATDANGNMSFAMFAVKVVQPQIGLPDLNFEALETSFDFFPNPATSLVTINTQGAALGTVTILNATGKEVMTIDSEEMKTQIEIDELPAGMYFIECNSKVKRFMKK